MKRKLLFIDRDGTLVLEPEDKQVDQLEKIKFLPQVMPNLLALQSEGYELVMVTNQDGLGTSSFPQNNFEMCQNFILEIFSSQGIIFKDILVCPHFPKDNCACRKPKTALLAKYLESENIDWSKCFVIGDRETDLELAKNLNCQGLKIGTENDWTRIKNFILSTDRAVTIKRQTKETDIQVSLNLDGQGHYDIKTGLNFFDHMLEQLSKHSGIDMNIRCQGDLQIDEHHTVEDVALTIGQGIKMALQSKKGIQRYGFLLPMDETEAKVSLDLSGRPFFKFEGQFNRPQVGDLPTELVPHFFRSLSDALSANLHIQVQGENNHHMIEACFKAVAKSLGQAVKKENGQALPSTKGVL